MSALGLFYLHSLILGAALSLDHFQLYLINVLLGVRMCKCVCVCVCVKKERERERGGVDITLQSHRRSVNVPLNIGSQNYFRWVQCCLRFFLSLSLFFPFLIYRSLFPYSVITNCL